MLLEERRETPIAAVRHQVSVRTLYGAHLVMGVQYSVDIRPWTLARRICSVERLITVSRTDAAALSRCMLGGQSFYFRFPRSGLELGGWKHVVCGFPCRWQCGLCLAVLPIRAISDFLSRKKKRSAEAKACETERFRMLPADRNRTSF
jgi:hypothetical protein